ncbi:MAG: DUF3696 domain-containing protein [Acidobacteria bacterium]|nr:MAG: DUF3696 domain-containing protein [Acidobacteriota bacterium]
MDLKFVFRYNRQTTQIELERGELSVSPLNKDGAEMAQLVYYIQQPTDSQQRYRAELKWSYQGKEQSEQLQDITLLKFYGIGLWKLESTWEPPEIGFLLYFQTISDSLETVFRRLFYIGPLRKAPERIYFTSGQTPQDVGMSGERVAEVLWIAHRTRGRERRLLDEIQQWLGKFGIASQLELEPLGETNYRVMLIDPSTRIEVNLADVGFGASQVLPVIVECLYAPEGSLLLMEQPEIHLHPKAQATLGDLFIEAVRRGDRQLIVETHSEHVLSRVRRRMAEGKIAPDEVAIYYFQPTSKGTRVQEIKLNEYGQYEEFPEGFFEEDLIEAFEHMDAIRKRTLKEKRSSGRQRMDD